MSLTKRSPAADIIRVFAFFSVVAVHFLLNNGFYTRSVEGSRMFAMTLLRAFFIICVPLFMMLSGFLLRKKKLEKSYYGKVGKTILTYILASLSCILYSVIFLKEDMGIRTALLKILGFTAAPYAWYIEMYLGLFLLIPFLNIIYGTLSSKKQKLWLIITFIILTSLPSVLNIYDLSSFDWLSLPSSTTALNKVFPAWWQTLYPVTYYYIGCYLSEYGLKINKALNLALIILCTLVSGIFCYWRSHKVLFIKGAWCSYYSLFNIILTTLVFAFIINLNYDKMPNCIAKILEKISGLCLGGYLVSWIFDDIFYPLLAKKVPAIIDRLEYFVVIVPVVFILSLLASYVLSILQSLIEKGFGLIYTLIKKPSKE